jgi:ABC-type nitrate/sulfonate/bicarbonate transport system substrate-binding protein
MAPAHLIDQEEIKMRPNPELPRINVHNVLLWVLLCLFVLASCDSRQQPARDEPALKLSIAAMPHSFTGYSLFVARDKGYLRDAGLDVEFKEYSNGKLTLAALEAGQSDFAVSSETPFIRSVMAGSGITAVASTVYARWHLAVVARRDHAIASAPDLAGKRIGVTLGSNGEYFLSVLLAMHGLSVDDVEQVHTAPGKMLESLSSGEVDAVATWNPQMHGARQLLGENGIAFDLDGLYAPYFLLVSRPDYLASNPLAAQRLLRALARASEFIRQQPDESRSIVARHLKTEVATLKQLTAFYDFGLSLNQEMLTILEQQANWIASRSGQSAKTAPDFVGHVYLDALREIDPDRVTIIK